MISLLINIDRYGETVRIILVASLIFFAVALCFVVFVLLSRILKTRRDKNDLRLRNSFQKTVNGLIVLDHAKGDNGHHSLAYYLKDLRRMIRSRRSRQVLITLLIANKQTLIGNSALILQKVYIRLQLKKFSLAKLDSSNDLRKIQGIQELAEMECVDALSAIRKLFVHKNVMVQQESFIAMVRLAGATPFILVDEYKGPITPWMQLIIHKHLTSVVREKLPPFFEWFHNPNEEIRKFAIMMAHQFRQTEAIDHLYKLLEDNNPAIAGLAAEKLGDMGTAEHADAIVALGRRHPENTELLLQVVYALSQLGNKADHGLWLRDLLHNGSYNVRFAAMRALKTLSTDLYALINSDPGLKSNATESMHAHISEPLLQ